MNAACIPMNYRNLFFQPINRGVSEAATILQKNVELILNDCSPSITLDGNAIIQDIDEVLEEFSVDNWDGYGARAIDAHSYSNALEFAKALPTTIPHPEVSVDPDGEIAFEWYKGPRMVFSVSIGIDDEINYAGLFGFNKVNGTENFYDEIPKAVLDNLDRLLLL